MAAPVVALLAPGDMGHAIGARLWEHGVRVLTCLAGRSADSAARSRRAGLETVDTDEEMVRRAAIFLSVVPPAAAATMAARIADAAKRAGAAPLYVDCNAVSPGTVRTVAGTAAAAGLGFVDASIIGGPPKPGTPGPRFYACGPAEAGFAELGQYGLDIRTMGGEVGQASALKMCYGALTKGLTALGTELLLAAELSGVGPALAAELRDSQSALLGWLERMVPSMPPKAYRWVAEMQEVALTFDGLGLPGATLQGAAEMYERIAASPLGQEPTENRTQGQSLPALVAALAAASAPS